MAWQKFNKGPSKRLPKKSWSSEEMKMIGFVIRKGIKIGISPDWKHDLHNWQIDIKIGNGKINTDPNRYDDKDVHDNVIKYYKYYYDKYKPNTDNNG